MMSNRIILSFFFCLFCTTVRSQLVNIESKRMQTDSIRFVLKSDFLFSYNNNNGDYIYQIGSNLTSQLKSKDLKKIYFLIGNYNLIRSGGKDYRNAWFVHLRFNYKISNLFRMEAFVQSQHNELLDINLRNLLGTGLRFKLVSKEHLKLYFGNAYMYEEEKSDAFNQRFYHHRHSSYISATVSTKTRISIINTIYYQPLYEDFGDYRILEQFKVEFPFSKSFNLFGAFNYYYDSVTPMDRKQFSSNISLGLGFNL